METHNNEIPSYKDTSTNDVKQESRSNYCDTSLFIFRVGCESERSTIKDNALTREKSVKQKRDESVVMEARRRNKGVE